LETESHYYGDFFYFDGEVSLPGFLKKISNIKAMFTTDFTPQATGTAWYSSTNVADQGCLTDGRMSPQEQALVKDPYQWVLIMGKQGGWANILQMFTESMKPNMKLFYLDDYAYLDPKEPDLKGTYASTGYYLDRLDEIEEVVSFRTYLFAIPNTFTIPDTNKLVNLVYHPVKVSVPKLWEELK